MNNPVMIVKGGGASGVLIKNGELYAWGSHDGMFGMGKSTDEYPSRDDVLTVQKSLFTTH
ncbi:MAG: hypothetical protein Q4D68_02440 [Moraxella equi]|nr:hypothetical protein [Moraxella equi]